MPCVIAGVFRRIGQLLKHNIYPHQHQKVGLILHVYTYLWFQVIAIWDHQKTWTAWWPKHLMPMVLTGHNLVPCRLSIYAWIWMELVLKKSSIMSFNHIIIIVIQLPQCHKSDKGHMLHWCIYFNANNNTILEGWTRVKISKWALWWQYQWTILYSRSEGWDLASDCARPIKCKSSLLMGCLHSMYHITYIQLNMHQWDSRET